MGYIYYNCIGRIAYQSLVPGISSDKTNFRKNMLQMRTPRRVHSTKTNFEKCLDINTLL